jgi:hypothetical protein
MFALNVGGNPRDDYCESDHRHRKDSANYDDLLLNEKPVRPRQDMLLKLISRYGAQVVQIEIMGIVCPGYPSAYVIDSSQSCGQKSDDVTLSQCNFLIDRVAEDVDKSYR